MALRYLTGGESHGPAVSVIIDGIPAGLPISPADIDRDLERRQGGHGRGGRMNIERDRARITSGVRLGKTLGSPVTVVVDNRDHPSWKELMSVEETGPGDFPRETRPRPGHGDFAGMLKYDTRDARDVLERASARETVARTAAGAVARRLLDELGVSVTSRVTRIGGVTAVADRRPAFEEFAGVDDDPVRSADHKASGRMVDEIDMAAAEGDTLGGIFEVAAFGMPPGAGSAAQADRRLDARLCAALISIPGVKGVEVGAGFALAELKGSEAHDGIFYESGRGARRKTNNAGGLEAGMTNGEPVLLRAVMKPIPTLARPLSTIDIETLEPTVAFKERGDTCAVPAASVVGEAVTAFVLADAILEKFGGDCVADVAAAMGAYLERIGRLWRRGE